MLRQLRNLFEFPSLYHPSTPDIVSGEGFRLLSWHNRIVLRDFGSCCRRAPLQPFCHAVLSAPVLLLRRETSHRKFDSAKIVHCRGRAQTWAISKIPSAVLLFWGSVPRSFSHLLARSRSVIAPGSLCSGGTQVNTSRD